MFKANVHIKDFNGFTKVQFHKKLVRKAMRKAGSIVSKESKKVATSGLPYQRRKTGELRRSIKATVSASGFMAKIEPTKTEKMKNFYPVILFHGVSGRIQARENFMADALNKKESEVKAVLRQMMSEAIK